MPSSAGTPRNKYSNMLANNAPHGAAPLPKSEMVRKTGYILSRISFRTIVMKKWKQSFWVQYGPHTMLWFRSESDFDDWLNNPYHTQAQRNFLIKLAVNFAHDLYKPNVRGYQVTQCRTKSYGAKLVRQFKLERWMDYGPTIAAAFGSFDPKEVDELREALVGCMRNTPLNGGIRATGAVREGRVDPNEERGKEERDGRPLDDRSSDNRPPVNRRRSNTDDGPPRNAGAMDTTDSRSEIGYSNQPGERSAPSVASEPDLLGDYENFDNPTVTSEPILQQNQQLPPQQGYLGAQQLTHIANAGGPLQQQQQYSAQAGEIVPVANGANQIYHGAPPMPPQQVSASIPQKSLVEQFNQPQGQHFNQPQGQQFNQSQAQYQTGPGMQQNTWTSAQHSQQHAPGYTPTQQQTYAQQPTNF